MRSSSVIGGIILILVGLFFLVLPLFPNLADVINIEQQWPLIIVAIGALFLLAALLGTPPLAVPGSVIGGIGLLLYYQNLNDAWDNWSFAWALIPGFVGIGTILMYTLQGNARAGLQQGGRLVLISLVLFVIFGALFGGGLAFGQIWPVALIGLGLWLLAKNLFRGGRSNE
jgi:hypothetical protein